jgi:branched-chain amino acid transport system permease protein
MDFATFLIQCLNALQYGLLLFLVASGLTLIFGIMGVINLAHGSFYMIGAYMAYALAPFVAATFGGGFFATLAVGVVLSVVLGYVLEWAFYSYLYEREHLQQVLMTYGLILVFEELRSLLVGDDVHGVAIPPLLAGSIALSDVQQYPVYRLFISGVCLLLALGMYFVFKRTRLGMMIRAGSTNREMVQSLGVDISFLYRVVFAAGVAIAVLAGMVASPVSSVYPGMGNSVLIICFVVVVIGGIGSIRGALRRGAADRRGRHLRQGAAAQRRRRAGVRADGRSSCSWQAPTGCSRHEHRQGQGRLFCPWCCASRLLAAVPAGGGDKFGVPTW